MSLAHHIAGLADIPLQVHRITFKTGRLLEPGETSASGAYALISKKTDRVLRIPLIREAAALLLDESRYLAECWITGVSSPEPPFLEAPT